MIAQLPIISNEVFHRCFDQWKNHWNKCIECQGDYFGKKPAYLLFIWAWVKLASVLEAFESTSWIMNNTKSDYLFWNLTWSQIIFILGMPLQSTCKIIIILSITINKRTVYVFLFFFLRGEVSNLNILWKKIFRIQISFILCFFWYNLPEFL